MIDQANIKLMLKVIPKVFSNPRFDPSESTQLSTWTKSVTKLGMEHLKMASLPTMMLSGEMLISYLWFVTETKEKRIKEHADNRHEGMLS